MNNIPLETKAIYINVPYCKSACSYCHYIPNITFGVNYIPDKYIDMILTELTLHKEEISDRCIESLYIGGGTPSLLTDIQIKKIMDFFKSIGTSFIEKSIEIHPQNINFNYLGSDYFTRYSIGVQSINDDILLRYNRNYNKSTVFSILKKLKAISGIVINIDFIFQTEFDTKQLEEILSYKPNSITIYPDTRGAGIRRLEKIYSSLNQIGCFFRRQKHYKELGKSKYIYLRNDSMQSRYSKIQNEFCGNILGVGNNAISDVNDASYVSIYDIDNNTIKRKVRYSSGRFLRTLMNTAAVGFNKRMISIAAPGLMKQSFINTINNIPIYEKHINLSNDDLLYVPEYNYEEFYDWVHNSYGDKYAKIFLSYISYFDNGMDKKTFFDYFKYHVNNDTYTNSILINSSIPPLKKPIPNLNILIEGIDGSGKDTFSSFLADELKRRFYKSTGRSISIVGQPTSKLPKGDLAKRFVEEQYYSGKYEDVIDVLTENRVHSETYFRLNKGINICIRGLLTDLATINATFDVECSSKLGLSQKYDYVYIITVDPKIAEERINYRAQERQWRESQHWLEFFQNYYETYPLDEISKSHLVIYNDDIEKLKVTASEIADQIYLREGT